MVDREIHVNAGTLVAVGLWVGAIALVAYSMVVGDPEGRLRTLLVLVVGMAATATARACLVTHDDEMHKLQHLMREANNQNVRPLGHNNTC